jgi:arylsulfatase A-like enzyme
LDQASREDAPFFMYLAFNAPHDPRQSPKRYVDLYPLDAITIPSNFLPEYPYNEAMGSGRSLRDERLAPFPRTAYSVRVNRQEYYAIITHMDDQIGRILDALEASGKADETYVFFTADHGLAVGHHGLLGKQNMFEHSMKPPLIVTGPDVPSQRIIETPVYYQDIMATTLDLAEVEKKDHIEFKSLMPLILNETQQQYRSIYGAYLDTQRMLRQGKYKLIHYPIVDKQLLFNLEDDPSETVNLATNPEYQSVVKQMSAELRRLEVELSEGGKIEGKYFNSSLNSSQ